MQRVLIGIVIGAFAALGCIYAVEHAAAWIWPLPPGIDPNAPAGAATTVDRVPIGATLMVTFGWAVGTLLGGGIAARVARRGAAAWIVAAFVVSGALATTSFLRHPGWMMAGGLLLPWPAALIVQRFARDAAPA